MNVREALEFAKKNRVQVVDLKFVDLIGTWQHFTIPASELTEDLFKDGSGKWKVFHLADTRTTTGCEVPKKISDQFK